MASHLDLGKEGEDLAVEWLIQNGFKILHRNWLFHRYEIDIIATKGKFLHFIEVKCRQYNPFGHPEDAVGREKFRHMQRAANQFLHQHPGYDWIQYDVLAITKHRYKETEYFFIEDVFY